MDILLPIGIGFFANMLVFGLSMLIKKDKRKATKLTLVFFGIIILLSLIIGSWSGMGLFVISLGILLLSMCLYLYIFIERTFRPIE
uniref:YesK family protein n=1 Tax=Lysinibacillus sp. FSL K6-0075 TaxID=2921415 RepID=UPI00406CEA8E